jgi:hypothetical protein
MHTIWSGAVIVKRSYADWELGPYPCPDRVLFSSFTGGQRYCVNNCKYGQRALPGLSHVCLEVSRIEID